MCVIAVSKKGQRLPTEKEIRAMFRTNPHGAGYMLARNNKVVISKGYMDVNDFIKAIDKERLTTDDSVVMHFRISTQAGVCPEMTQPFPYTRERATTKVLDCKCSLGIAHNGIIPITSTGDKEYSDTALFITDYLTNIIRYRGDINDDSKLAEIEKLIKSKMALLDASGTVKTIGKFTENNGILFSNMFWNDTEKYNSKWKNYYPRSYNSSDWEERGAV